MKDTILLVIASIGVMAAACYALAVILFPRRWLELPDMSGGNVGEEE